jgi:tagaturonate reductase
MILSQENLHFIQNERLVKPHPHTFELPEKVLQFGTGVLLRGLPDYFINKANQQGVFNGRAVVVKSTKGGASEFDEQDNLYTLCIRGLENGQAVEEYIISSAISRVIAADKDWQAVLKVAESKALQIIISNTTEVGISLLEEQIDQNPPESFPAKVLAVLYHRFKAFNGANDSGLVIIATELIPANGSKLASIVKQLAVFNDLEAEFLTWLDEANTFCNSLVDRIVPGKPAEDAVALEYTDRLLTMAEPYRLWAIEGGDRVKEVLEFAAVDPGVIIAEDIEIYRELKVRLLNGTHTLSAGIAFLLGIGTVKNAMSDRQVKDYITTLMASEISVAIPYAVTDKQTKEFSNAVIDRFANPYIEHLWHHITFQYTMKMKIRILPLLSNYFALYGKTPNHMAFGFAAYLLFMKATRHDNGQYYGSLNGTDYVINDDSAAYFYLKQKDNYVIAVLTDVDFWKLDLTLMPGFIDSVNEAYQTIVANGLEVALGELSASNIYSA